MLSHCLVLKICRIYNLFGIRANHDIHAQLMSQASTFNDGQKFDILQGSGSWFVTCFFITSNLNLEMSTEGISSWIPAFIVNKDIENELF